VIAVRAGAARPRHHQAPDRSLLALQAIEELARETAEEIDQIVGTLRDGSPADGVVEAPPGLASLHTLITRHTTAGLRVTLDTAGAPRPLSSTTDQAAYRILQEALTNAAGSTGSSARRNGQGLKGQGLENRVLAGLGLAKLADPIPVEIPVES
jgi:signal transduction histidine kinase